MAYIGSSPTKVVSRQSANIFTYTATANQTAFTGSDANGNTLACTPSDIMVHMNGLRLEESDFTATTTTVTLGSGAAAGDEVTITAFVTFETADAYTKSASDTRYVNTAGDTMTGALTVGGGVTVNNGHVNIDSGYSYQWGDSHERIEQSDGKIEFFTNNGEQMTLSGSSLGIGTAAPLRQLHIHNTSANSEIAFTAGTSGASSLLFGDGQTGTDVYRGYLQYQHSNDAMLFATSATERMRLTQNHALFGMTTNDSQGVQLYTNGANGIWAKCTGTVNYWITRAGQGAGNGTIATIYSDTTSVGSITITSSSTSYNTSSDYRLKENVTDVTDGITRVKQLAPKRFNFIADADTTVDGFLAHEAATVVPEAVTGTKDQVDDDGNAVMQEIDQAKFVPLLTAALQEAIAKIETLETKVAALEGG